MINQTELFESCYFYKTTELYTTRATLLVIKVFIIFFQRPKGEKQLPAKLISTEGEKRNGVLPHTSCHHYKPALDTCS